MRLPDIVNMPLTMMLAAAPTAAPQTAAWVASTGSELRPINKTMFAERRAIETSLAPHIMSPWKYSFDLNHTQTGTGSYKSAWLDQTVGVIDRMNQLEARTSAELRALSRKVDQLANALGMIGPAPVLPMGAAHSPEIDSNGLAIASSDDLPELLGAIADGVLSIPSDMVSQIISYLEHTDARVRASAGRALSAIDPAIARTTLLKSIEVEQNRFVRSILRGALQSAEA